MSKEWHVEYRIEVEAESAEEAARKVAVLLANGGAERGVYHVHERTAVSASAFLKDETEVDLGTIDGTWEEPVMQHFTSGYRATHGLPPANHDPYGYVCGLGGDCRHSRKLAPTTRWKPRPEFDVPDNPILADFRRLMGEIIQTGSRHTESPAQAAWWVELLEDDPNMLNPNSWGHMAGADRAHIKHARRVLAKLATVYA